MTTPRKQKKARILVKLVGADSHADFIYEYENDADAQQALKTASPVLGIKATFLPKSLDFRFTINGVPVQTTKPSKPSLPNVKPGTPVDFTGLPMNPFDSNSWEASK